MGKETKIGMVVVGVLLLGFGGLLARRVMLADRSEITEPDIARAAQAAATNGKPTVVMAQREAAGSEHTGGRNPWKGRAAESGADVPRASYMPADTAPGDDSQTIPPADDAVREGATDDQLPAEAGSRREANPFSRTLPAGSGRSSERSPPHRLEIDAQEATAIEPADERPSRGSRNPLRRTSVEFPVTESEATEETPNELANSGPQPGEAVITSGPADSDPAVDVPRDEDTPTIAVEPTAADDIPVAAEPLRRDEITSAEPRRRDDIPTAGEPRSPWRGSVAPASNRAVEPVAVEHGKYTVQPNDNLWIVSEKVYGTGRYFKAIYEHNRTRLPHADRLTVGTVIAVPPVEVLEQNYPALVPKQRKSALVKPRTIAASTRQRTAGSNVYVVEEGDTLFDIARYELGKASRWAEIYDLNRDALGEDFDYLQPGTELAMPPRSQDRDSLTRQRDSSIQR